MIVVTNSALCKDDFLGRIEQIAKGKPKAILLREKQMDKEEYRIIAKKCKEICEIYKVPLIINHQIEIAKELKIGRIHLSFQELLDLRKRPEDFSSVGVSIHSEEEAVKAKELGVDYLVAGHIFATDCKKDVKPRGLEFLGMVCKAVDIPVYAIGGIKKGCVKDIYEKRAVGICIMSELMECENPEQVVKEYMGILVEEDVKKPMKKIII